LWNEQTADEAGIAQDFILVLLLAAQVCKRVDNDTKDEVQHDDYDNEEEDQVVDDSCKEQPLLQHVKLSRSITKKCRQDNNKTIRLATSKHC